MARSRVADEWRKLRTLVCASADMVGMRLSALRSLSGAIFGMASWLQNSDMRCRGNASVFRLCGACVYFVIAGLVCISSLPGLSAFRHCRACLYFRHCRACLYFRHCRACLYFVIAGLDPAIHADKPYPQPGILLLCESAWTTGSSPVVTMSKRKGTRHCERQRSNPGRLAQESELRTVGFYASPISRKISVRALAEP